MEAFTRSFSVVERRIEAVVLSILIFFLQIFQRLPLIIEYLHCDPGTFAASI
jgi:hypothetical protein